MIDLLRVSDDATALIAHFESFSARPYKCPAGLLTIGYGHVILENEPYAELNMTITKSIALDILKEDISIRAEAMKKYISPTTTRGQFESIVSLAFNAGISKVSTSNFLNQHNAGNYRKAEGILLTWCKYRDPKTRELSVSNGLLRRRLAERELYRGGDWTVYKSMAYFGKHKT